MSRIGKMPIQVPEGVSVKIDNGEVVVKSGQKELRFSFNPKVNVSLNDKTLNVEAKRKIDSNLWGLTRTLIYNMIIGVTKGFEKKLEIEGVGYTASISGDKLVLKLGFSHPIEYKTSGDIQLDVKKNIITVSGIDKQLVGQVAAEIREFRKPEPYKGKGIHYLGEHIRRKEGKKAVASEGEGA